MTLSLLASTKEENSFDMDLIRIMTVIGDNRLSGWITRNSVS